jgi:hypothetical protein
VARDIETSSSQKLPVISIGYDRLRGRKTARLTNCVSGPVVKLKLMACQGVVPIVVSLEADRHDVHIGSVTRSLGPLSEAMFRDRT